MQGHGRGKSANARTRNQRKDARCQVTETREESTKKCLAINQKRCAAPLRTTHKIEQLRAQMTTHTWHAVHRIKEQTHHDPHGPPNPTPTHEISHSGTTRVEREGKNGCQAHPCLPRPSEKHAAAWRAPTSSTDGAAQTHKTTTP